MTTEPGDLWRGLDETDDPSAGLKQLGRQVPALTSVSGAAIGVDGHTEPTLFWSDSVARDLDALQFVLGEGPSHDARSTGRPTLAGFLDRQAERWPLFVSAAVHAGTAAVFVFPLHLGLVSLGTLLLHRDRSGHLEAAQVATATLAAEIASHLILAIVADAPADTLPGIVEEAMLDWTEVHQATGMIAVQLQVEVPRALVSLRARAFAEERPIGAVAADVVARRLRFKHNG